MILALIVRSGYALTITDNIELLYSVLFDDNKEILYSVTI